MMGRIPEEKPCSVSRVSNKSVKSVDLFDQARKALSDKSPFDDEEVPPRVSYLPSRFSAIWTKHSDRRRRKFKKLSQGTSATVSNIWEETEDYFRAVTSADIDFLASNSVLDSVTSSCFYAPVPLEEDIGDSNLRGTELDVNSIENAGNSAELNLENTDSVALESQECRDSFGLDSGNSDNEMEIGDAGDGSQILKETDYSSPDAIIDLRWVLGSRNRVLSSERPSKKRKLLDEGAGLKRLFPVRSSGSESTSGLCDFCVSGETHDENNRLLQCSSCHVIVHQKCYGVREVPGGAWTCCWCRHLSTGSVSKDNEVGSSSSPCLLCPNVGGALKPVALDFSKNGNNANLKFAHLFCCQWMPELYVENTEQMEPVMNMERVKETRKKLVCYLCKVKYGTCIRCSHGTCRTSFHPMCARKLNNRMEIWGKVGFDNVDLRAFCSKHSSVKQVHGNLEQEKSTSNVTGDSLLSKPFPTTLLTPKLKLLCNGKKNMKHNESRDDQNQGDSFNAVYSESQENENAKTHVTFGRDKIEDMDKVNPTVLVSFLKKLLDQGKIKASDIARDVGISSDILASILKGEFIAFTSEVHHSKLMKWLLDFVQFDASTPDAKCRTNSSILSLARMEHYCSQDSDVDPIKSILPARRTSNIRILKDNKIICSSVETVVKRNNNGKQRETLDTMTDIDPTLNNTLCHLNVTDAVERQMDSAGCLNHSKIDNSSSVQLTVPEGCGIDSANCNESKNKLLQSHEEHADHVDYTKKEAKAVSSTCMHPFIHRRLIQVLDLGLLEQRNNVLQLDNEGKNTSSSMTHHQQWTTSLADINDESVLSKFPMILKAREMGVLEFSPKDELEGELIYYQNRLLDSIVATKRYCDDLVFVMIERLSDELTAIWNQKWDDVFVSNFLREVKEAKKQGRKEKRFKEAQAILAAATAAVASSSRNSSLRKDAHPEFITTHQEGDPKTGVLCRIEPSASASSLDIRPSFPNTSAESHYSLSQLSKEHQALCEICGKSEAILNRIVSCSNCKVTVHLGCYRKMRDPVGPWYCDLCQEITMQSASPKIQVVNNHERSSSATQCCLCIGSLGAFRKSSDGQWVHALCAEWILESTFKRGQPNLVEGVETLLKERDEKICCICNCRLGVCIKCNHGNCQTTFHPSCGRTAGLFMTVRIEVGSIQHKAYCQKHSLEQRGKEEALHHGPEEFKNVKQIRVELERVRLLCERIIRREKLKRELVLCSHDILASKRNDVALSVLVHSSFFPVEANSDSAASSLNRSRRDVWSGETQRMDDTTVSKAVSSRSQDIDRNTDDSSTSQLSGKKRKAVNKQRSTGKQLLYKPTSIASPDLTDDRERPTKLRKSRETFQKELVMTSDQASLKNQRLPKGFVYVPVGSVSKKKGSHSTD